MDTYISFGNAGKGEYCIKTEATVKGIVGSAQTIKSGRTTCFTR
jgi:hypothetical protein